MTRPKGLFTDLPIDVQLTWRPDIEAALDSIIATLHQEDILLD